MIRKRTPPEPDYDQVERWAEQPRQEPQQAPDQKAEPARAASPQDYPWNSADAQARRDVERNVLTPLPEDYRQALRWLAENGYVRSQRAAARGALTAHIDELVEEATGARVRDN